MPLNKRPLPSLPLAPLQNATAFWLIPAHRGVQKGTC